MILTLSFLLLMYCFLIGMFVLGFEKISINDTLNATPETQFSIIISFRNEAENLPNLLQSLSALNYTEKLFEIIFVDDASEDASEEIIQNFMTESSLTISLIKNTRVSASPKKDAITKAIKGAKFKWIVTTDADCQVNKNWLLALDACIQKETPYLVAGPVKYVGKKSKLHQYQVLDSLSLTTVAIGGFGLHKPLLVNGANLAYKKSIFSELNGFSGNDEVASGDDIFMLQKIYKAYPNKISYIKSKNAVVITKPENTWAAVISQRIRWASKTKNYNNSFSKTTGILVFVTNFCLLILLLFILVLPLPWWFFIFFISFKIIIDFIAIARSAIFLKQYTSLFFYPFSVVIYPILSTYIVFASLWGNYKWKGRAFKK